MMPEAPRMKLKLLSAGTELIMDNGVGESGRNRAKQTAIICGKLNLHQVWIGGRFTSPSQHLSPRLRPFPDGNPRSQGDTIISP